MRSWSERTPAVADLLNPAFLAVVTAAACSEYERRDGGPMPLELAFLVAPLVLHRRTRAALPKRYDSHLARWVTTHEVLAAGFGERARALVQPVREGIRFGLRTGSLQLEGTALTGNLRPHRPAKIGDIADIVGKAGFVGRWFAQLDSPVTAFALLGVEA